MKLGHIELFVRDAAIARAFYREVLGARVLDVGDDGHAWVRLGEQDMLLRPDRRAPRPLAGAVPGLALVLYTEAYDASVEALRRHGVVLKPVEGYDRRLAFADPDGHWFHIADPRE